MIDPTSKAARREAVLQRVQQVLLAVTEDLADAVASTSDEDKKARLAGALAKITRGLRQSVYLEAKLERETAEAARAERERAETRDAAQQEVKDLRRRQMKAAVKHAAMRQVWGEDDPDEVSDAVYEEREAKEDSIDEWLELASGIDGFAETALDAHVDALMAALAEAFPGAKAETAAPPLTNGHDPGHADSS